MWPLISWEAAVVVPRIRETSRDKGLLLCGLEKCRKFRAPKETSDPLGLLLVDLVGNDTYVMIYDDI